MGRSVHRLLQTVAAALGALPASACLAAAQGNAVQAHAPRENATQAGGPGAENAAGDERAAPSQTLRPRLIGNLRLRYEHADDDVQPDDATALTLRYRGTVEANLTRRLTLLGEIEAVGELIDNFNDGRLNWSSTPPEEISDRKFRPVIPDPGGVELNRAQALVEFSEETRAVIGRQRIVLDDERFIGVSAFRQNDRTFDALRFGADIGDAVLVNAGYIRNARRVIRDDAGFGVFNGDSYFAHVNAPAPAGRLSLFHYALDLETGPQGARDDRASTRTTGARLEGRRYWGDRGVLWEASFARQVDHADNPVDFAAHYWLGELGVEKGGVALFGRAEILSGNTDSLPFTTPLATLRRFQGNADIFFVTPADGVVDVSARAEWRLGAVGPFRDVQAFVRRHWFSAETTGADYGVEIDAEASAVFGQTTFSAAIARYRTRGFAADTDRVFLTVSHAF